MEFVRLWEIEESFRDFFDEPFGMDDSEFSELSSMDFGILFEFRVNDKREVNDVNEDFVVDMEEFLTDVIGVVSDRKDA